MPPKDSEDDTFPTGQHSEQDVWGCTSLQEMGGPTLSGASCLMFSPNYQRLEKRYDEKIGNSLNLQIGISKKDSGNICGIGYYGMGSWWKDHTEGSDGGIDLGPLSNICGFDFAG